MKLILLCVTCLALAVPVIGQQNAETHYQSESNEYMFKIDHDRLARAFESSRRDQWQKPEEVIASLGDLHGKTVVDLGSGSGYFTFRLVKAGARVIAADIDTVFLSMIEEKRDTLQVPANLINTLKIHENSLDLPPETVDVLLIVNVYHHLTDRVDYFRKVNDLLKENGKIVIVDFYKKTLPVGPPKNHKLAQKIVLQELSEAGFVSVISNNKLLPYQYIITADKY